MPLLRNSNCAILDLGGCKWRIFGPVGRGISKFGFAYMDGNRVLIMARIMLHRAAFCGLIPTFSISIITTFMIRLSKYAIFFVVDMKVKKLDRMTGLSTILTVPFYLLPWKFPPLPLLPRPRPRVERPFPLPKNVIFKAHFQCHALINRPECYLLVFTFQYSCFVQY